MGREHDSGPGATASEQAADWFLRLQEPDCTAGERAAFERWRADPVHAEAYRQVQALWRDAAQLARADPGLHALAQRALSPRADARAWWRRPSLAAAAAVALALVAGGYWLGVHAPATGGVQHATLVGEQRSVTLEDRSTLVLDTQTVLVERYSARERRIDLQRGQAQFQVQGNPERPFVVHAGGGTVTAIGTRFQVRVDERHTTVTLLEGRVQVATRPASGPARSMSLQAGQALRFSADGMSAGPMPADLKAVEGWTEGKLVVDQWRLQDLISEINRYSDTRLRIDDADLRELPVSGTFYTRDRAGLARMLEAGWDIRSRPVSDQDILLTRE